MPKQNTYVRPWDMSTEQLISELYIKYGQNANGATREQLINTIARLRAHEDLNDNVEPNEMTEERLRLELSQVYGIDTDGFTLQQLRNTLKEILADQVPKLKINPSVVRNAIREPERMTSQELRDELILNFTQTVNGYNDRELIDAVTRLRSNQRPAQPLQMEELSNAANPIAGGKRKSKLNRQNRQNKRHFKIWF
jgi:hypothetical protein